MFLSNIILPKKKVSIQNRLIAQLYVIVKLSLNLKSLLSLHHITPQKGGIILHNVLDSFTLEPSSNKTFVHWLHVLPRWLHNRLSEHLPQQTHNRGTSSNTVTFCKSTRQHWCVCSGFSGRSQQAGKVLCQMLNENQCSFKKPRIRPLLSCCSLQCKIGVCVNWHVHSYSAIHSELALEKNKHNAGGLPSLNLHAKSSDIHAKQDVLLEMLMNQISRKQPPRFAWDLPSQFHTTAHS